MEGDEITASRYVIASQIENKEIFSCGVDLSCTPIFVHFYRLEFGDLITIDPEYRA